MKQPKPWFWKARKAWYVQLDNKQVRLHENEKEANAAYFRLMASSGRGVELKAGRLTVEGAVESCIMGAEHHRPNTVRLYRDMLGPFAGHFQSKRLTDITSNDVIRFVSTYQGTGYRNRTIGDSTRALMFRFIKTLFRWCRDTGLIQINPLHSTDNPWRVTIRTRLMTEKEYMAIMSDPQVSSPGKEVLEFLWRTGCRPGEIVRVEARHLDANNPIVRLQPTEHKTGTKTGLQREIFIPPDLMLKLRAYAADRPRGSLLRNSKGAPWTSGSISEWFSRARDKLGLPEDLVLYLSRHAFATRLISQGNPIALVAKLAGHTDAQTIQRVYYHPDTGAMAGIVGVDSDDKRALLDKIRAGADAIRAIKRSETAARCGRQSSRGKKPPDVPIT